MKTEAKKKVVHFFDPVGLDESVETNHDGSFSAVLRFGRFRSREVARAAVTAMFNIVSQDIDKFLDAPKKEGWKGKP